MNTFHYFKVSQEEGVTTVLFSNPPVNALNQKVMKELRQLFETLQKDPETKVVLFTTETAQAFIAGADIGEFRHITTGSQAEQLASEGQETFNSIEKMSKPVIAAIHGVCVGGGNELVMACHIRIGSDRARFGQPEIGLGILPGFGGTQRLPRIVGLSKATELILTGEMISAQEALRIGLVNAVVPDQDLMKQAKGLAKKIASKGGVAIAQILFLIDKSRRASLEEGLKEEAKAFGKICETEDMKEGVSAFLEKRHPQFKNR